MLHLEKVNGNNVWDILKLTGKSADRSYFLERKILHVMDIDITAGA